MIYLYVGAAIIVGLLIGFVALSVKIVAEKVSASIRERAAELLSTYDKLVEKKSKELRKLNSAVDRKTKELEELGGTAADIASAQDPSGDAAANAGYVLNVAEMMGSASYQDPRTGAVYQKIRSNFNHDPLRVITEVVPGVGEKGPATKILEQLSYDTIFKLSALSEEQQLEVLDESLDYEGRLLLHDYAAKTKKFQAIAFYDHLLNLSQSEPQTVKLKVSPHQRLPLLPSGVEVEVDEDICEGFEIEANNNLYDYCVRKSEIS